MSRFSFLHAADLHLDTPFEGIAALHPATATALQDASLAAWDRLVELALRRQVAFVLLAGDLYDGPERGLRAQLRFAQGLERLAATGIECFIVHGNHDPLEEGWSALRGFPAGVHVFAAGEPTSVAVVREGRVIATVQGTSFGRRAEQENLARRFRRGPEAGGLQIGLLHANVEGQAGHDPYAPCSLADLAAAGLDYWALGHIHQRQVLARVPGWVVYPGNLQGRSCKASECGPKGAVLVHCDGGAVREVEFVPLAPVRFERLRIDVAAIEDLAALQRRILEDLQQTLRDPSVQGIVVRVELEGRGPLHHDLVRAKGGSAGLLASLRDATEGLSMAAGGGCDGIPWVHWEGIRIATSAAIDRAALLERDDFTGELLRRIDLLLGADDELEALLLEIDAPLASSEIARHLQPADPEEARSLLLAAESFAIDRLGGEP